MNTWFRIGSLVIGCACIAQYTNSGLLGVGIYFIGISFISEAW